MLEKIYTGNGSETKYDLTFNYLTDSDINVGTKAQGADPDIYTTATLTTDYTISNKKVVFNSAPANNTSIRIRRITKVKDPRHLFHAGSSITADSLNKNSRQVLYALEERDLGADNTSDLALAVGAHNHIRVNSASNWEIVDGAVDANALGANAVTAAKVADNAIENSHVADDAIGVPELSATGTPSNSTFLRGDNAWAQPWHYTHPNHSGEVTSTADGAQVIADNVVDEDNFKITGGSNGDYLQKQSGADGGFSWVTKKPIVQAISVTKTDTWTTSSGSPAGVTGLTLTIQPTSSSNKILFIACLSGSSNTRYGAYRVVRNKPSSDTVLIQGDAASNRTRAVASTGRNPGASDDTAVINNFNFIMLDSPGTTDSTVYEVQIWDANNSGGVIYLNRTHNTGDEDHFIRGASTLTALEIAG